jgi:hypothetical protein
MIPVLRPKLPLASKLQPYLEEIDNSNIYTNFGPMVENLTSRLAEYLGLEQDSVVLLSSATAALEDAIINSLPKLVGESWKNIFKSFKEKVILSGNLLSVSLIKFHESSVEQSSIMLRCKLG